MLLGPQRERRVGAGPSVTQGTVTGSEQGGRPGRSGGGSERGGSFGTRPLPGRQELGKDLCLQGPYENSTRQCTRALARQRPGPASAPGGARSAR